MRILFIGQDNLQNQAIAEILKSEDNFEVDHIYPVQVEERVVETNPHKYKIALVDLNSFSYSPDVSIKMVKTNNLSEFVVALHTYRNKKLIQPILNAGADHYLSLDSDANDLLEMVSSLSRRAMK